MGNKQMDTMQLTPSKLQTVQVASLTNTRDRWKIRAKVRSKSERAYSGNGVEYFKVILEDESGMIEALAFGSQDVNRFFNKFEENKVYFISDGKVTRVNQNFPNVGHDYQIQLMLQSAVTLCEDTVSQSPDRGQNMDGNNGFISQHTPGLSQCSVSNMDGNNGFTSQHTPGLSQCSVSSEQATGADQYGVTNHYTPGLVQCGVTNQQTPGVSQCSVTNLSGLSQYSVTNQSGLSQYGITNQSGLSQCVITDQSGLSQCGVTNQHTPSKCGVINYGSPSRCRVSSQQAPGVSQCSVSTEHAPGVSQCVVKNQHTPGGCQLATTCMHTTGVSQCGIASQHTLGAHRHNKSTYTPVTKLYQTEEAVVDVVGKVTGVWKLEMKLYTHYRRINIADENGFDVIVELWNKQALDFSVRCIDSVIALKNVKVNKIDGLTELQSTPETEIDYSPADLKNALEKTRNDVTLSDKVGNAKDIGSSITECNKNVNSPTSGGSNGGSSNGNESKGVRSTGRVRGKKTVVSNVSRSNNRRGSRGKYGAVRSSGRGRGKGNESETVSLSGGRGRRGRSSTGGGSSERPGKQKSYVTRRGAGRGGRKVRSGSSRGGRGRRGRNNTGTVSRGNDSDKPSDSDDDDNFIDDSDVDDDEDSVSEEEDFENITENSVKRIRPRRICESKYSNFTEGGSTRKSATSNADDDDEEEVKKSVEKEKRPRRRCSRSLNLAGGGGDSDKESNETERGEKETSSVIEGKQAIGRQMSSPGTSGNKISDMQDKVYSVQETVVPSDSDLDDENEEQAIKPVSAKKSNKVASSDSEESDATMSYTDSQKKLLTPGSSGKRSHHSDDDSDDDNDDVKGLTESEKKKFKRIKRIKGSSQETKQGMDNEDTDNSESEESNTSESATSTSQSDSEGDDSDWSEEGPEDNDDDDFGTRPLLRHYILWFAMTAGGESCDREDLEETVEAKGKLEGRIEVAKGICESQAWSANFKADIRMYPEFIDYKTHEEMKKGDIRMIGNCQVCNRQDHPWAVIVTLEGEPYDENTYETEEEAVEDDSLEFMHVQYYMGRFCRPRTKLYHNLYHFGYHLYQRCKTMLEDGNTIDDVARDRSLQNEMYVKLKRWLREVENDYTEDGERANRRWNQERQDYL